MTDTTAPESIPPAQIRRLAIGAGTSLEFFDASIGAVLGDPLSPSVADRLIEWTGQAVSVSYYLAARVAVVCLLLLPETAPIRTRTGR